MDNIIFKLTDYGLFIFYFALAAICLRFALRLFSLKAFARRHRLLGLLFLFWLFFGWKLNQFHRSQPQHSNSASWTSSSRIRVEWCEFLFFKDSSRCFFVYDLILGCLGISLTLSAAFDFELHHSQVINKASGALEANTTITVSEMLEHAFFQLLNLLLCMFLHCCAYLQTLEKELGENIPIIKKQEYATLRVVLLFFLVIFPWFFRNLVPVNSFSKNYSKINSLFEEQSLEARLYRIKKWSFVFMKHFLHFGLAITVALQQHQNQESSSSPNANVLVVVATSPEFRRYWLAMSTSFALEFFLQTLVKKSYIHQRTMLCLNIFLMIISSPSSVVVVFRHVSLTLSVFSTLLNFWHRGHDVQNSLLCLIFGIVLKCVLGFPLY